MLELPPAPQWVRGVLLVGEDVLVGVVGGLAAFGLVGSLWDRRCWP